MTQLIHPAFTPLHAHLAGANDLLHAGVTASRLLSLYPVELQSYEHFLRSFYAQASAGVIERICDSYALLAKHLSEVEQCAFGYYDDLTWSAYASFVEEEIEQKIGSFATALSQLTVGDQACEGALKQQLNLLLRWLWISSNWPTVLDTLLTQGDLDGFFKGGSQLAEFFNLPQESCERVLLAHA